ncbi:MAG: methyltransferase domain-containing protein [Proteobacteria bacterium]|nr:methyltransferase domain-containing protein [Pseudomonadota bacterium]
MAAECLVCGALVEEVISLPKLPLTGLFCSQGFTPKISGIDQGLMLCTKCGHGQAGTIIDTSSMYGDEYGFRTSLSRTAAAGCDKLFQYLTTLFPDRHFGTIVDLGCNDGYLLNLLREKGNRLLGVDPIWQGRESEFKDPLIQVIGDKIEETDLNEVAGCRPDLVVSQHTMEHIEAPAEVLARLLSRASDDTVFVFGFPSLDLLIEQYRFDRIFHQHLQYFSVRSFETLLQRTGGELLDFRFDPNYWGSQLFAFKKRSDKSDEGSDRGVMEKVRNCSIVRKADILKRYKIFSNMMNAARFILDDLRSERWYGYGAALMLPVLAYHLQTDFSEFEAVLDDDPKKDGMAYANLPVKIVSPKKVDIKKASIFLTSIDNRRLILKNLLEKRPRRILDPLALL